MSNWHEGTVDSNGVPIHYYRTGNGTQPPLLLVHGFTDNGLCWSRLAQHLESDFDLVMVDSRNHGRSGSGGASLSAQAEDLAKIAVELRLAATIVVGHSVGASVAAAFAGNSPNLVSKLILEDPPWVAGAIPQPVSARRQQAFRDQVTAMSSMTVAQIIEEGQQRHPHWHREEFGPWAESNQQVHAEALALLEAMPWQQLVAGIQCPTLLLFAEASTDGVVTEQVAAEVVQLNPLIRVQSVPDSGHNLRRENFAGYLEAVSKFLNLAP